MAKLWNVYFFSLSDINTPQITLEGTTSIDEGQSRKLKCEVDSHPRPSMRSVDLPASLPVCLLAVCLHAFHLHICLLACLFVCLPVYVYFVEIMIYKRWIIFIIYIRFSSAVFFNLPTAVYGCYLSQSPCYPSPLSYTPHPISLYQVDFSFWSDSQVRRRIRTWKADRSLWTARILVLWWVDVHSCKLWGDWDLQVWGRQLYCY